METQKILCDHGLSHNTILRTLFDNFLVYKGNEKIFQDWLLICSGYLDKYDNEKKLYDILSAFYFVLKDGYTFSMLVGLNKEWYNFFTENIYPCGTPRNGEGRKGVSRKKVNRIMFNYKDDLYDAIYKDTIICAKEYVEYR